VIHLIGWRWLRQDVLKGIHPSDAASRGIVNPGTSALCTAYPVDCDGLPIGAKAGSFTVDHYQIAVPIQRGR
jgi:hypothetical protein